MPAAQIIAVVREVVTEDFIERSRSPSDPLKHGNASPLFSLLASSSQEACPPGNERGRPGMPGTVRVPKVYVTCMDKANCLCYRLCSGQNNPCKTCRAKRPETRNLKRCTQEGLRTTKKVLPSQSVDRISPLATSFSTMGRACSTLMSRPSATPSRVLGCRSMRSQISSGVT